ncbi:ParA family protein [Marinomonas ostreistagni]|uniref:ParA family protein n=1 Tax=Marinomonas ostreistagni TaxID=359209 RepID=A0ABS0ZDU7_9GAMM|nr:ParA family protein [Marinomonas ostreistagni]MBJ7551844.1 ParA family protein [Marinomonas ostreistagni]
MQVITVCNRKGGMGKSTTVVNLARQWSKLGRKVLVVDLDSQGHATLGLLGLDYMTKPQAGVHQLINDQNIHLPEVIIQTEFESLSLLPADLNFNESKLVDDVTQLKQRIQSLPEDQFDLILIDTPPSLSNALLSALVCADWVLIPFIPHALSMNGIMQLSELFKEIATEFNPSLKLMGLLPVMEDRHIRLQNRVINTLSNRFGSHKLLRGIRTNIRLAEAFELGSPIQDYSPNCRGAMDYHMLAHDLDLVIH